MKLKKSYYWSYITAQEFNKLTSENSTAIWKQANLAYNIRDISIFIKRTDLNKNELNELSKTSWSNITKGLTKDLIN